MSEENNKQVRQWSFKDLVAISISIIALTVSLIATYFNLVWSKDDISVALGNYPGLFFSGQIAKNGEKLIFAELGVSPQQTFTFVNNGTRTASIIDISFWIRSVRRLDTKKQNCMDIDEKDIIDTQGSPYRIEPFPIKPGEIIIKTFRLGTGNEKAIWYEPNYADDSKNSDMRVYACIDFGILTPGRNLRHVAKVVSLREEKNVIELAKQATDEIGISRDIQRGPWPRGALISLVNETHFLGPFEKYDLSVADYGVSGCACGDEYPVLESYQGEANDHAQAEKKGTLKPKTPLQKDTKK